jgi:predicted phosphate transport protein (TIGR00153 family)
MRTIARLFSRSPFSPLQTHLKKVIVCFDTLWAVFSKLSTLDAKALEKASLEIAKLEHEADITKNDIRNHLPKSLFLPIDRGQFLEILSLQDTLADKCEEIAFILTLHPVESIGTLQQDLATFFEGAKAVFKSATKIVQEIDELLEASFGGQEAEKVKAMVDHTASLELEVKRLQKNLLKKLYQEGSKLSCPAFTFWASLINKIALLSHTAEKLAHRIRMVLELR